MVQIINSGIINESQLYPQPETKEGSDCSGSDGAKNRTLTLTPTTVAAISHIIVNGAGLHEGVGKDFTRSGSVITFLNAIYDVDNIRIAVFA